MNIKYESGERRTYEMPVAGARANKITSCLDEHGLYGLETRELVCKGIEGLGEKRESD